jgi:ubiquitin C-terminal hydrolase
MSLDKLLDEITIPILTTSSKGLPNLGNTCYLNSVLQTLFHTQRLKDFFIDIPKCKIILLGNAEYNNILVAAKFYQLFISYWSTNNENVIENLREFKTIFGEHFRDQFFGFRQNDQHECINYLLLVLHEAFGVKNKMTISGNVSSVTDQLEKESLSCFKNQSLSGWRIEKDKEIVWPSIISDLFSGQFHERTECTNCGYVSSVFSSFRVIQMSFPIDEVLDINSFLNYHTSISQLSEENLYKCDKCEKKVNARQRITIWKEPKVLFVSLKRFLTIMEPTFRAFKINKKVVPTEVLDLDSFLSRRKDSNLSSKYDLYSVCIHSGGIRGGHCISEVKSNDNWKRFDDQSISDCSSITKDGYIFAYTKHYA